MITRRSIPAMLAGLVAAFAACVLAVTPSLAADKVKFGMLRVPQALLVGIDKGYFKNEGIEVEPVLFRSGAELVPSLSTGQMDIAVHRRRCRALQRHVARRECAAGCGLFGARVRSSRVAIRTRLPCART